MTPGHDGSSLLIPSIPFGRQVSGAEARSWKYHQETGVLATTETSDTMDGSRPGFESNEDGSTKLRSRRSSDDASECREDVGPGMRRPEMGALSLLCTLSHNRVGECRLERQKLWHLHVSLRSIERGFGRHPTPMRSNACPVVI